MAIAGVALALVAATTAGCGDNPTSAQPTPSPDKTELVSSPSPGQELSIDEQLARQEKFEAYAPAMEQYKFMDVDTFEALPRDERLPYSQYALDEMVIYDGYESSYGERAELHDYMIDPVAVSLNNTGQEIMDCYTYNIQRSYLLCGENDDGTDGTAEGNKALSSVYYSVGKNKVISQAYLTVKTDQRERNESIGTRNEHIAQKTSDLLTGKDLNREVVQYKNITFETRDKIVSYGRFVYHKFTSYDGSEKAVWLLDALSDRSVDELNSLGTIR